MLQYLDQNNFDQAVQDSDVVLVDFYADWCGPCRVLHPALESLSKEFDGKATIAKVNVDQSPELSREFGVTSIPALYYFKNGEIAGKQVGVQTQANMAKNLTELIEN
ncbi:MAG: thioredoxin [Bacteroidota bacterium]